MMKIHSLVGAQTMLKHMHPIKDYRFFFLSGKMRNLLKDVDQLLFIGEQQIPK